MKEYNQHFSDRAMGILAMLKQPHYNDIKLEKSYQYIKYSGTEFTKILSEKHISMEVLRKLLRKELYGVCGVFFYNFAAMHNAEFVSSQPSEILIEKIKAEGYRETFSEKGALYKMKMKSVSRQRGLYVPPSTQQEFEHTIDNEDFCFTKGIKDSSLSVLEYFLKHSISLREKYGNNWYPYFSSASIARDLKKDENDVAKATANLTGIVCEMHQMVQCERWRKRFFLSSAK